MGSVKRLMRVERLIRVMRLPGLTHFMAAYDLQKQVAKQHFDGMKQSKVTENRDTLILLEHAPVYTIGIRDNYSKEEVERLLKTGAEFHRTNRGGLITFHGPGQLVAYPVINLKHFGIGMREYIGSLERTMIQTCNSFGLDAMTTENTGVWIGDRKIGAIGVHGSRYVTTHGVSLNCNTDLERFTHIVPCGIEGKDVTSLSRELNRNVSVTETIPHFLKAFREIFQCMTEETVLKDDHVHH